MSRTGDRLRRQGTVRLDDRFDQGTRDMLDFCGEKGIVSEIEKINIQQVNEAYERVLKSDVRYRFVIDMASLDA
jgi:D-arabinose 1-dehydrogenase-like Zn-dependent alcohol dehydrogenase